MKMARKRSGIMSKIAFFVIIVGLLVAVAAVIFSNLYKNTFFAEQKFQEITKHYYEDNVYETILVENNGESLENIFKKYPSGIYVKLRQALSWEFLENNMNYRSYFETDAFSCDTNTSTAKFTPRAPYGKKDYDVEFNLKCNKS